eukprot:717050-Prymnesium_polylepis.1
MAEEGGLSQGPINRVRSVSAHHKQLRAGIQSTCGDQRKRAGGETCPAQAGSTAAPPARSAHTHIVARPATRSDSLAPAHLVPHSSRSARWGEAGPWLTPGRPHHPQTPPSTRLSAGRRTLTRPL